LREEKGLNSRKAESPIGDQKEKVNMKERKGGKTGENPLRHKKEDKKIAFREGSIEGKGKKGRIVEERRIFHEKKEGGGNSLPTFTEGALGDTLGKKAVGPHQGGKNGLFPVTVKKMKIGRGAKEERGGRGKEKIPHDKGKRKGELLQWPGRKRGQKSPPIAGKKEKKHQGLGGGMEKSEMDPLGGKTK